MVGFRLGPVHAALLFAVLALAGCAESADKPAPAAADEPPAPVLGEAAIAATGYVQRDGDCGPVPQACLGGPPRPYGFATTPYDAMTSGVHVQLSDDGSVTEAIDWHLTCLGDEEWCRGELAAGQGTLPFAIDVDGLWLLPETDLLLTLVAPSTAPGDNMLPLRPVDVSGRLLTQLLTADELPTAELIQRTVSYDGHTGPCVFFVQADCISFPGGTSLVVTDLGGTLRSVNLTLTWASLSELDRELGLRIEPYSFCTSNCPAPIFVRGTSPLAIQLDGLRFEGDVEFKLYNIDPTATFGGQAVWSLRTPAHLEGLLVVEPPFVVEE